jgi:hypothetical protein
MFKVTPNPPESAPASPYESPDFKSFHEADDRALDHYLGPAQIMVSTNQLIRMYVSNLKYGSESLLANDSETIGSASEVSSTWPRCSTPLSARPRSALRKS